jgi:DNA polymerase-3 subunit epsilon
MCDPFPRLAFVDLETTGATASTDRITEIGIVVVDEGGVGEWSTLVNPRIPIPEFIRRLTGIDDGMVATAPTFAELAAEVHQRLEGCLFIAHNARFDYGFLRKEFERVGIDFHARVLCTVRLSRRLYPQFHKHSLDALIERHALATEDRHRALADARLIWQFWQKAQGESAGGEFAAAVAELTARPMLPGQLDPEIADRLPESPGVYVFFGESDQALHVGRARNLRQRVLAHFANERGSAREAALVRQVRRVEWQEIAGETGILIREAQLLRQLQPTGSRRQRANDELCAWQLAVSATGQLQPRLVTPGEADFGGTEPLYGLYRSPRDGKKALTALAEAQGLCLSLLGLEARPAGQACGGWQTRRCRGACIGKEPASVHSARLQAALASQRLRPWPFAGAAMLREHDVTHVVDRWRYLGTATSDDEVWALLEARRPDFDADIYAILVKAAGRLRALTISG